MLIAIGCESHCKKNCNVTRDDSISFCAEIDSSEVVDDELYRNRHIVIKTDIVYPYALEDGERMPIYHIIEKEHFIEIVRQTDKEKFSKFMYNFEYADNSAEALLYDLVAANKFGINWAKRGVASCITELFSNVWLGNNSRVIALKYMKQWKPLDKEKRMAEVIIKDLENAEQQEKEIMLPKLNNKSTNTERLKAECLKGSISAYKRLKNRMYKNDLYIFLLYYSYLMADRYDYTPARKDVIDIIERFYKEYDLGPLDKDTEYFCSFFR